MTARSECPGCGLAAAPSPQPYDGGYHASPACWAVYTEVLGREFGDALLFGQAHHAAVAALARRAFD